MPATEEPGCRVMICDDVAAWRLVVATVLRLAGMQVVCEAEDGVQAIEVAAEAQPDVVLLDIAMPRMDGITALPAVLEAAPRARVVMLSGFNSKAMQEQARAAGAHGFLEKGVDPQAIVDAVRECCRDRAEVGS